MSITTPSSSTLQQPEYIEGVDYIVRKEQVEPHVLFYFEDLNWKILWYVKTFYEEIVDGTWSLKKWYIVDTVSAYKLEKNIPEMLALFESHWYDGFGLKGFWTTMYKHVLRYFQETHWSDIFLQVNAYERNIPQILRLLDKVQEQTNGIIERIRWWDDWNAAVIYLKDIATPIQPEELDPEMLQKLKSLWKNN